ncbi:endo alpha-1,4 polygalactosaminidase [Alicyclobacillus curvatus]|jgi:hypothetical protein|nr:endo alpha-1,4 polygalactosaminidase [Alicyclobacillus curvatus]
MSREAFKSIKKFAVYYGPKNIMALGNYDCVIIEPSRFSDEDIILLKERGALVIAYVTVMEIGPIHKDHWAALREEDFLHRDGKRIEKVEYNTFLLDLTSARWRALLHQEVGKLLAHRGFDGILLDTIGDVEDYGLPDSARQIEAAGEIVAGLRRWFPKAIIIQNNGLEALCLHTAPYLDGITWENPPISQKPSRTWVKLIADRLDSLSKAHGVTIMTLYDRAENLPRKEWIRCRRFADEHGYLSYFAPTHYLSLL